MKQLIPCDGCGIAIQKVRGSPHAQGLAEHECRGTTTVDDAKRKLLGILVERANDAPLSEIAELAKVLGQLDQGGKDAGSTGLAAEIRSYLLRDN